jgi:hypothetical protein
MLFLMSLSLYGYSLLYWMTNKLTDVAPSATERAVCRLAV